MSLRKKVHTLVHLDWHWAYRYARKRYYQRRGIILANIRGIHSFDATVGEVTVKLHFFTPYHWSIADTMAHYNYEHPLPEKWIEYAASASLIFDAGAFNGFYGLLAAKANPKAQVY